MREGAAAQPLATLTAIDILRSGGNAVDAAVAACAVQCVVEAGSTGIGGDCFALLSLGGTDKVLAYNGSGRAPAAATVEHLRSLGVTSLTRTSPHTITVPGAVDAWTRLVADHGRMKMADILAPAVKLARDGYVLPPRTAHDLAAQAEILKDDPAASRVFLVDGKAPPAGSVQYQKQLADTLEAIGREGRDAFYRGPIAGGAAAHADAAGGGEGEGQESDDDAGPLAEEFAAAGSYHDAVDVQEARRIQSAFRNETAHLLAGCMLLALPTLAIDAPPCDASPGRLAAFRSASIRLLCLAGLGGYPQLAFPVTAAGLELSLSLMGAPNADRALVETANRVAIPRRVRAIR